MSPLVSVMIPVMLPRSDCAKHSVAARKTSNKDLIVIEPPSTRNPRYMWDIVSLQKCPVKDATTSVKAK